MPRGALSALLLQGDASLEAASGLEPTAFVQRHARRHAHTSDRDFETQRRAEAQVRAHKARRQLQEHGSSQAPDHEGAGAKSGGHRAAKGTRRTRRNFRTCGFFDSPGSTQMTYQCCDKHGCRNAEQKEYYDVIIGGVRHASLA
mmetsp:Transcript_18275/g.50122  ORF Transcript_18275/g.50122 Transcript_18275/m.50122 type:complete len:144 (+) Transcript_18275:66-497(+)